MLEHLNNIDSIHSNIEITKKKNYVLSPSYWYSVYNRLSVVLKSPGFWAMTSESRSQTVFGITYGKVCLFRSLRRSGRTVSDDFVKPSTVLYSSQAHNLIKKTDVRPVWYVVLMFFMRKKGFYSEIRISNLEVTSQTKTAFKTINFYFGRLTDSKKNLARHVYILTKKTLF